MPPRFICPHGHSPIDPLTLEVADSVYAPCRVCPECDDPIVLTVNREGSGMAPPLPSTGALLTALIAESGVL